MYTSESTLPLFCIFLRFSNLESSYSVSIYSAANNMQSRYHLRETVDRRRVVVYTSRSVVPCIPKQTELVSIPVDSRACTSILSNSLYVDYAPGDLYVSVNTTLSLESNKHAHVLILLHRHRISQLVETTLFHLVYPGRRAIYCLSDRSGKSTAVL